MKLHALCVSASVLTLGWWSGAVAQTNGAATKADAGSAVVPELVVTAERRTESLQKTPIAATVLTEKDIVQRGVFTVNQLQFVSPSLTVNSFGQGNDFDIRGIGKGEHNTQTSTGVITYRDGVATFPGYFQEEPYFDIASVQILRGPQGTFSGQNATGGAVIVDTRNPVIGGGEDGYVLGHYGNYNDTGFQGAVNVPISDTLAARVAINTEYRDTFYHITGPWTGDPNTKWASGRISLLWRPTSSLSVLFKTDYDYLQNGGYFGDAVTNKSLKNLFNFANNAHTYATDQFIRSILKVDYVNSSGITFRSISSYQRGRTAWDGDIDGTALPAPNYIIAEAVDETLWSQEFNVISPNTGPVTWVVGAYYDSNNYNFPKGRFDIGVPPGFVDEELYGRNDTYALAAFGQVSVNLPAGFQIQAGARYSFWSTWNGVTWQVPEFGLSFYQNAWETGQNVTGKVTLNWNLNSRNFLYAFVATGAKPGGLNGALYFYGGLIPPPFKQEYVTDYEVGWKSSWFNDHLHTQVGGYYNNFDNFQVIIPIPNNPTQTTEINDPSSTKLYGVEASAQAVIGDFSFDGGLGLETTSLGKFFAQDPRLPRSGVCNLTTGPASASCIDLAGHPQTYAPNFTYNLAGHYTFHLAGDDHLTASVDFSHISHQWGTLFDNVAAGDYLGPRNILGASLAWTHGSIVTTLYGYNLTDDHYVTALLPPIRIAGNPRQFGISVMKTF